MHSIEEKVLNYIRSKSMLAFGDKVLLSLSAGKDSMAMLHILKKLADILRIELGIFHLNHLLRGEESDKDAEFTESLASEMNIPFYGRSFDFKAEGLAGRSFEEYARNIRYEMLTEIKKNYGYSRIAVAHNLEDNAETVLMRIFSGAGLFGLRGIPSVRDDIIRPLRSCSVKEILAYLRDEGLKWREDASNGDTHYRRNYIRNKLLPLIEAEFPGYALAIDGLGGIAESYTEIADKFAEKLFGAAVTMEEGATSVNVEKAAACEPVFGHLLASAFRKHGAYASRKALEEISRNYRTAKKKKLLYSDSRLSVEKIGGKIRIKDGLHKTNKAPEWSYAIDLSFGESKSLFIKENGMKISCRICSYSEFLSFLPLLSKKSDKPVKAVFVAVPDKTSGLIIRNRRAGDRIQLSCGTKKIKDLFIDNKIDSEKRAEIPLLELNSDIIAVMAGFLSDGESRVSISAEVSSESEKIIVLEMKE